jgi:NAD-dependent deacetylase
MKYGRRTIKSIEELRSRTLTLQANRLSGRAGTSTESGIPDFRSDKGVFRSGANASATTEVLLSTDFFLSHPGRILRVLTRFSIISPNAKPNDAHRALASLERAGNYRAVIHAEYRRSAPEGGQQKRAGAARYM